MISIVSTTFILVFLNEFFIILFSSSFILKILPAFLLFLSIILLIIYTYKNFYALKNVNLYFKFLLFLLLIWSLFTIGRSINTNPRDLLTLFTHYRVGGPDWVTPLAIFFGLSVLNWFKFFPIIEKFLILGICFTIFSLFSSINLSTFTLLSTFSIILLTYKLHRVSVKRILIVSILSYSIYNYLILSNRSSIIILVLMFSFFIFEYFRNNKNNSYKKIFLGLFLFFAGLIFATQVSSIYNSLTKDKTLTSDTRTFLLIEMFKDMNETEKLIGRGALGQYYSPYFNALKKERVEGGDAADRSTNEIGYLHMILKGGYIMMLLYLLILIPAAYLGIFKSKNTISKMSGYLILSFIIMFTLIYPPEYKIDFILLWMAVGTTISKKIRNFTDEDLIKIKNKELNE